MEKSIIYNTVRSEILDQKKCQFQMFAAAITFSSALFAFGTIKDIIPIIFIAPILMNVFALTIILDKSISIQRMVGYLQLMENEKSEKEWMWEYHLNIFRGGKIKSVGREPRRKHKYIQHIALMLFALNTISVFLLIWKYNNPVKFRAIEIIIFVSGGLTFLWGIVNFFRQWYHLVYGRYTASAIKGRWKEILTDQEDIRPDNSKS
jgi:hypothetical protein